MYGLYNDSAIRILDASRVVAASLTTEGVRDVAEEAPCQQWRQPA
jgi:hypothetical protein